MSLGLRITEAATRDADILGAMHALCFPFDPWGPEAMAALLATPGTRGLFAARLAPEALALVRFAADEAELLTLGVVPEARRQGVGGQILDAVIEFARKRCVRALFLEVAVNNDHARRLYAGRGFREVGRRPAYYGREPGPKQDALILKLAIGPGLGHDDRRKFRTVSNGRS